MSGLFDRRVRGFRIIEIGGLCVLLALALVVYMAKTHAGGERADIDRIQSQIDSEQARVTLLKAEIAKLEQPERLASLAGRYLNLAPIPPGHEISATGLSAIGHVDAPPPPAPPASSAAPAATDGPAAPTQVADATAPRIAPTAAAPDRPAHATTVHAAAVRAAAPDHTIAVHTTPVHASAAQSTAADAPRTVALLHPRPAATEATAPAADDKGPPL